MFYVRGGRSFQPSGWAWNQPHARLDQPFSKLHPERMRWKPLLLSIWLAGFAMLGSACTVFVTSATPTTTTHSNEAGYRRLWSRDWAALIRASRPWNPSFSSPGVCDKGGSQNACYTTDERVLPLVTKLREDLQAIHVPAQYARANKAMLTALALERRGLIQRDTAPRTADNDTFGTAVKTLAAAVAHFNSAYTDFPDGDRPSPALFGSGRHAS